MTVALLIGTLAALAWLELWRRDVAARTRRQLDLEERRLSLEERRMAATLEPEEMPLDLRVQIDRETETWAREQLESLVRQLHGKHRNWDAVRTELSRLVQVAETADAGWSQTRVSA